MNWLWSRRAKAPPDAPAPMVERWKVDGESVLGVSHERKGLPNQDCILWWSSPDESVVVMAVADGHGSARCMRSDRGSKCAVQAAVDVLQRFVNWYMETPGTASTDSVSLSSARRRAEEMLPSEIHRQWMQAVGEELQREPLTPAEVGAARGERSSPDARVSLMAYGTTLLAVAICPDYMLCLQLGDGDILVVLDDGSVSCPVPGDERLIANETTSLCSPNAPRDFRCFFQVLSGEPPALVLLSTDGYSNSFSDDKAFEQVGSDILAMLRAQGPDYVRTNLHEWLTAASREGSGDDISLGLIYRVSALSQPETSAIGTSPEPPVPEDSARGDTP